MYVCDTAVGVNADSDLFPEDWLMKHRWGKGKKDANTLPNGEKITFLKVGGRTSAIVANRQKKTAAVAGDVSDGAEGEEEDEEVEAKPKKTSKRKVKAVKEEDEDDAKEEQGTETIPTARPRRGQKKIKDEVLGEEAAAAEEDEEPAAPKQRKAKKAAVAVKDASSDEAQDAPTTKKRKTTAKPKPKSVNTKSEVKARTEEAGATRRSGRLSK